MLENFKKMFEETRSKLAYEDEDVEFEEPDAEVQAESSDQPNAEDSLQIRSGYIIAFMSGKGGMGKTGMAINVANFCAAKKKRVLLVDCDINTKGATTFFKERRRTKILFQEQSPKLSFQKMFSLVVSNNATQEEQDPFKQTMCIKEYFYFIPASLGDGKFNMQNVTEDVLTKLDDKYFSEWRKIFDLIILDLGAGGGILNIHLSDFPDKICIVMTPNKLSQQAVHDQLPFLFEERNLEKIICCINMMDQDKRIDKAYALFYEFPGFIKSSEYTHLFDNGRMITESHDDLYNRLSDIVRTVYVDRENVGNDDDQSQEDILNGESLDKAVEKRFRLLLCLITFSSIFLCLSLFVVWYVGAWDKVSWWIYVICVFIFSIVELYVLQKLRELFYQMR